MRVVRPWPAVVLLCLAPAARGAEEPLRLERSVPLPGVEGRMDHLVKTADGTRIVVAALANDTVEVVDLAKGAVVRRIEGQHEPQGVAIEPKTGRIVVAGGGDGVVRTFDPATYAPTETFALGGDADNLRVDAAGRLVVGYGDGGLATLAEGKVAARVPLPAHPESFQLEAKGPRAFVNVPGARRVVVVDRAKGEVAASWEVPGARDNYPMALDEATHRLFVGCRTPARFVVLDTEKGTSVASVEISGDVDDVFLDAKSDRLYLSCGEGFVDVVARSAGDRFARTARVPTAAGARTCLFDPSDGRLYLAVPHRGAQRAELRVYATR